MGVAVGMDFVSALLKESSTFSLTETTSVLRLGVRAAFSNFGLKVWQ